MEIWKDIKGFEDFYQVSDKGRVRSLDRVVTSTSRYGNTYEKIFNGKILIPHEDSKGIYLMVSLCKNGKAKTVLVHDLVANAFHENPNNLPCINHKDENTKNNAASNLEFCTFSYNINYGTRNKRQAEKESIPVIQYDLNGVKIKEWKSSREAERGLKEEGYTDGITSGNISGCCKGRQKTAGGFIWRYGKLHRNNL